MSHPLYPSKPKTALVLAGGGITGAVYEIGALRAMDDLLLDLDTTQFDIYVGTSAGAMIAAFLANGISPAQMMRGLDDQRALLRGPRLGEVFTLNTREWLERGLSLPFTIFSAARRYARHYRSMRLADTALSLAQILPTAIFYNISLADYIHAILIAAGGSDRFTELDGELYIVATDLDNGQRAVFGEGDLADVPISLAVAASSALPLLYRPVRINNHEYVDGGIRGTASIDIAIEHGAQVVVVVNPLVPLDMAQAQAEDGQEPSVHLSDQGMSAVAAQVYRTLFHAGFTYHLKQIQRRYPDVTLIVIEPDPTDHAMFFLNSMRFSVRMTIAQHGYESVTVNLAQDYRRYRDLLAQYGIAISPRRANEALATPHIHDDPEVIRAVMEGQPVRPFAAPNSVVETDPPLDRLEETLRELDAILENRSPLSHNHPNGRPAPS